MSLAAELERALHYPLGDRLPTPDEIRQMHHQAHEECFIASSVRSEVRCEPTLETL